MVAAGRIGLDTVRIATELRGRPDLEGWVFTGSVDGGVMSIRSASTRLPIGVPVFYTAGSNGREYLAAEWSVPKLAGTDNVVPAHPEVFLEQLPAVTSQLAELCPVSDLHLTRLDIARDFYGVDHPGPLLLGLSSVPVGGRKTRDLYRDSAAGDAQTLFVRTRSGGGVRLYDKYAESAVPAAEGVLRAEAQVRRRWLRALDLSRPSDLTDSSILRAGLDRFAWAGFDRPVAAAALAVERILSAPLNDSQKWSAAAAYLFASEGRWGYSGSRSRWVRARQYLDAAGVFPGVELGTANSYRLDYLEGLVAA